MVSSAYPVSRSWHGFGVREVEGSWVGSAEVHVEGPAPAEGFVGAGVIELDPERFAFGDEIEGVVDLFAVEPFVLERSEGPFSHTVLAG
jgi:hypothetical protein